MRFFPTKKALKGSPYVFVKPFMNTTIGCFFTLPLRVVMSRYLRVLLPKIRMACSKTFTTAKPCLGRFPMTFWNEFFSTGQTNFSFSIFRPLSMPQNHAISGAENPSNKVAFFSQKFYSTSQAFLLKHRYNLS